MKNQSSENELVITEEFIFDQNKLSKDPNNHFKARKKMCVLHTHFKIGKVSRKIFSFLKVFTWGRRRNNTVELGNPLDIP